MGNTLGSLDNIRATIHNKEWQKQRDRPYTYIQRALKIFKKINGSVIVEIGSMREPCKHDLDDYSLDCCNDGHSSLLLARSCEEFHTCDIDMSSSRLTYNQLKDHNLIGRSSVYNGDGIKFLLNFDGKIDLLYLDAWDVGVLNYANIHLEAFKIVKQKLNNKNIVLIDDTDINFEANRGYYIDDESLTGKGSLIIPHLLDNGYKLKFKGRQTCLTNF